MRNFILSLVVLLSAAPAFAGYKACTCLEFERRANGLEYVTDYVQISYQERNVIQRQLQRGYQSYSQVDFYYDNQDTQNRLCTLGNQAVDPSWRRWQSWLAQHGVDYTPNCRN
ncbi:MAG: hypothetical protein SGI74_01045 [Oligoflexia bacterium]|nr:hypothetical protein [Oligoflexia bacterium]